jgi:hypothetical protein
MSRNYNDSKPFEPKCFPGAFEILKKFHPTSLKVVQCPCIKANVPPILKDHCVSTNIHFIVQDRQKMVKKVIIMIQKIQEKGTKKLLQ